MEILTKSARETQELGEKIGTGLKTGCLICLYGDLGSGKTTFMQGLALGLGIKKRVLSPTFIIVRQYEIGDTKYAIRDIKSEELNNPSVSRITSHISRLYHVDLYRIKDEKDIESLGLEEIWGDPKNVIAIEWPEKIEKILPKKRVNIHFEYVGDDQRLIRIENFQIPSTNFQ